MVRDHVAQARWPGLPKSQIRRFQDKDRPGRWAINNHLDGFGSVFPV